MNRLLEGDVGSGKTVIAGISALTVSQSGFQSALMAPTEILAQQHYRTLTKLFKNHEVNILLFTGSEARMRYDSDLESVLIKSEAKKAKEHKPKQEEFVDVERTRQVFFNISRDLIQELSESKRIKLSYNELNKLASILVRHTIGFGIIEVLLQDKNLQDISLNAPISQTNIYTDQQHSRRHVRPH